MNRLVVFNLCFMLVAAFSVVVLLYLCFDGCHGDLLTATSVRVGGVQGELATGQQVSRNKGLVTMSLASAMWAHQSALQARLQQKSGAAGTIDNWNNKRTVTSMNKIY